MDITSRWKHSLTRLSPSMCFNCIFFVFSTRYFHENGQGKDPLSLRYWGSGVLKPSTSCLWGWCLSPPSCCFTFPSPLRDQVSIQQLHQLREGEGRWRMSAASHGFQTGKKERKGKRKSFHSQTYIFDTRDACCHTFESIVYSLYEY